MIFTKFHEDLTYGFKIKWKLEPDETENVVDFRSKGTEKN